ncbi:MAG TPA: hypothetical protein VK277_03560 [Acidimicrobiales bacterium]|nr:hypothetical protein [Acidimicrobiales bacterium]
MSGGRAGRGTDRHDHPIGPATEGTSRARLGVRLLAVGAVVVVGAALAVPRAFGTGGSGADSSAQSDLVNAVASLRTIFVDQGAFPRGLSILSQIDEAEAELSVTSWLVTTDGPPHSVSLAVSPDGYIVIVGDESTDDRCWYIEDNEEPFYGTTDGYPKATSAHGLSYDGTRPGVQVTGGCGYGDAYLTTGGSTVGWGPSFPS